jgi:FAD/FMN-containing dehydrogenase
LGIVTAATVKLFPRPRQEVTALVTVRDLRGAITVLRRLQDECGDAVTAFEVWADDVLSMLLEHVPGHRAPFADRAPFYALFDVASFFQTFDARAVVEAALARLADEGVVQDATVAASEAQASALWRMREEIPEGERRAGAAVKHDLSVPVSRVPEFVAASAAALAREVPGCRIVVFGHLGDGSLHYNVIPPGAGKGPIAPELQAHVYRIVHDVVVDHGGSISAEHGIGRLKRDELWRYRPELDHRLMRAIKAAFDPAGLMNPGKVV